MSDGPALLPQDVNEILKNQSKNNRRKACYPCHQRKVACDGDRPCKRCINRDHPDLCSYAPGQPQKKKRRIENSDLSGAVSAPLPTTVTTPQLSGAASNGGHEDSSLHAPNIPSTTESAGRAWMTAPTTRNRSLESVCAQSEEFMGGSSVPGFILDGVPLADAERLGTNHGELRSLLLPALGLQRPESGSKVLPTQQLSVVQRALDMTIQGSEVIRMFQRYKESMFSLSPHLIDIAAFEAELVAFLQDAELIKGGQIEAPSLDWLATFFAILAAGSQLSHHPYNKRTIDSKLYTHEAFACLYAEAGYITPNISTITTLMILITVLQNNLEAEVAWSYLGLASRLAQSMGLGGRLTTMGCSPTILSSNAWQAIVWQDCLLSMSLGRRPCALAKTTSMQEEEIHATNLDYRQAMYELANSSLNFVDEQNASPIHTPSPTRTLEHACRLQRLLEHVRPEICYRERSRSIADHTKRLALRLNVSFALATLLRPALGQRQQWLASPDQRDEARKMCIDACMAAVDSFVGLHHASIVAERSWSFMHNGLSCALILLLIDEARHNERIRNLQKKLLNIVHTSSTEADRSSPLWGPHARILSVFNILESARSVRSSVGAQRPTSHPSRAEQGEDFVQENFDANQLPAEPTCSNINMLQDEMLFADYLHNLADFDGDDDGMIGMYDSILWGNIESA